MGGLGVVSVKLIIVCDCGSTVYQYWYHNYDDGYDTRCSHCNAIVHPFNSGRVDFLYRNEQAGYVGTD